MELGQKWNGRFFERTDLKTLGMVLQLNHASLRCPNPADGHKDFKVLHPNGIHSVSIKYCGCQKAVPHHIQLLRRGLYPATQHRPRTCASFRLLEFLHLLSLTSKGSVYDFYRALEKLSAGAGLNAPKVSARSFYN